MLRLIDEHKLVDELSLDMFKIVFIIANFSYLFVLL
jgi:hypothetical protein